MNQTSTIILLTAINTAYLFIQPLGAAQTYLTSDFTGTTADGWSFVNGMGAGASLTAATGHDAVGDGWLRLTNNAINQASFVYQNTAVPTSDGLVFNFDIVIYGNSSRLADGIGFVLFADDASTPMAGGYGGSLGYANRLGIGGLTGGILGVGFDVFGNYSNFDEGRIGGIGRTPNAVAIRGSMGANVNSGYEYLIGTQSLEEFSTPRVNSRAGATVHNVRITIPTDETITVEMKNDGTDNWTTLIDGFDPNIDFPDTLRFGFTGATGASYAFHEIRHFEVTSASGNTAIPEPGTMALAATMLLPCLLLRRRNPQITIASS